MTTLSDFTVSLEPNSVAAIRKRVADGKVPWTGPLLLLAGRGLMWMAAQGIVALIFLARHVERPWHDACYWWSVCFTLSDIFCLAVMRHYTRREGMRMRDLIGPIHMRFGRDIFLGLGCYLLIFPFFMAGGFAAQMLFYGPSATAPNNYIVHAHALPLWAVLYSISIYWIVQSATEELTYQGFVLPRLEALTGHTSLAVFIVAIFFAAQHCALAFVPDGRAILFRFLAFLPGCAVAALVYVRTRRLAPLIVAHWLMDIGAVLMTAL